MSYIGIAPVLEIADRPLKHWRAVVKWVEDKFLAVLLLIAFAPLMAIAGLLIKLESRGPVLFVQHPLHQVAQLTNISRPGVTGQIVRH